MKKIITLSFALCAALANAQEAAPNEQMESTTPQFKRWAIDLGAGVSKPSRPFAAGFTNTPSLFQADLGVRYMISRSFGIGLEGGYNNIKSDKDSPVDFENRLYRVGLEGIVNLGNLVDLKDATGRFGILGHGGLGVGFFKVNEPVEVNSTDHMLNATIGITPQLKLSESVALFGDLTAIGTIRNSYTWDGFAFDPNKRGFQGLVVNASVGLSFYLGQGEVAADWAVDPMKAKVDELATTVERMALENADDDQDGVPNYLDRDNTTESGVRVDSKGRALDMNKNGIPDDMESALDSRYAKNGANGSNAASSDIVKTLINEGYVNVFFEFNSTKPTAYSYDALNTIVTYMKRNSGATASLTGYADEIGSESYNEDLSSRRAKFVQDVLVASGIPASRLSMKGEGEDASVDKNSGEARQLVRKVTFRVN